MIKKVLIGSAVIVALGAVAMASMGGTAWLDSKGFRGTERQFQSRVTSYWNARVMGNLEEQASYLHPLQGAIADPGMLVTEEFQVNEIAIEGDQAMARLTLKTRLRHPILSSREREVEMVDQWVRYEGNWYRGLTPRNLSELIQFKKGEWTPPTAEAVSLDETPTTVQ